MPNSLGGTTVDESITYELKCRWDGEKFILSLPQIGLEKEGQDFAPLHAELIAGLKQIRAAHRDLGLAPPNFSLPEPQKAEVPHMNSTPRQQRSQRMITALVAVAAILLVLTYVVVHLVSAMIRDLANPANVARAASSMLDKTAAAARGFTPDREEQMREDIHVIVEKLKPLADELRPLFEEPSHPGTPPAK